MKRNLRILHKYPNTADEIYEQLSALRYGLPGDFFMKLSHSMIQRCTIIKNFCSSSYKYW